MLRPHKRRGALSAPRGKNLPKNAPLSLRKPTNSFAPRVMAVKSMLTSLRSSKKKIEIKRVEHSDRRRGLFRARIHSDRRAFQSFHGARPYAAQPIPFAAMFSMGGTVAGMSPKYVNGLDKALENIEAFRAEVIARLRAIREAAEKGRAA